jgi:hypothetical protein
MVGDCQLFEMRSVLAGGLSWIIVWGAFCYGRTLTGNAGSEYGYCSLEVPLLSSVVFAAAAAES